MNTNSADPFMQMYQSLTPTPCPNPVGVNARVGCEGLVIPCMTFESGVAVDAIDRPLIINPSDLQQEGAIFGQVLSWDGSKYIPRTESSVRSEQVAINLVGMTTLPLSSISIGTAPVRPSPTNGIFPIHINDVYTTFYPTSAMLSAMVTVATGNAAEAVWLQVMFSADPSLAIGSWKIFGPQVALHGTTTGTRAVTNSILELPTTGVVYLQLCTSSAFSGYSATIHSVNLTMYQ